MGEASWVDQGNGRYSYRPDSGWKTLSAATMDPTHEEEWHAEATGQPPTTPQPPFTSPYRAQSSIPSPDDESVNGMLRRLIFLKSMLKTAEADIKTYKAEIKELDERIRLEWAEDNINSAGIDGKTAYLYPVYHVEKLDGVTTDDIRAAMEASGLDYMVKPTYSGSSLTAYLKELREHGDEPPAALAAVVKLVPSTEIRLRDSGSRVITVSS